MKDAKVRLLADEATGRLAPLDGVRGIAVLVVMAYHSGIPGLRVGGFYGQDAFFVLSGLLITSLLLDESAPDGRVRLLAFWARRGRRLLPALVAMLVVVDLYVSYWAPAGQYPGFRADALSALFYVSNWHLIASGSNYFATSGAPSLLTHTWSLAIEEQFYAVWPLTLLGVLHIARRRRDTALRLMLAVSVAGTLLSAAWMGYLYRDGASASRLYYGTDTHAQCLLTGASLAVALHLLDLRRGRREGLAYVAATPAIRAAVNAAGGAGLVGVAWMWTHVAATSAFAYEGGFLCFACLTALVLLTAVTVPRGPIAHLLSVRPLAYLGTVSYGMYLWYFPIFAVVTHARFGLTGSTLFAVRVVFDIAIATISYYWLERPLRSGRLFRVDRAVHFGRLRPMGFASFAVLAVVGLIAFTSRVPGIQLPSSAMVHPATPSAAAPKAATVRILVVGDSTALTLAIPLTLPQVANAYGVLVSDQGRLGCGVAESAQVLKHGQPSPPSAECNPRTPAGEQWPAVLQSEVDQFDPDVVLVAAGRFEVLDRRTSTSGPWQNITQANDARYVGDMLETAIRIGSDRGAHVDLATAPCYSTGEQLDGQSWPEDDADRVRAFDNLVTAAVSTYSSEASVLDLGALVCPGGVYRQKIDGVTVRAPDGIHYPFFSVSNPSSADPDTLAQMEAFGRWVSPRIMPALVASGRNSAAWRLRQLKPTQPVDKE